MKIFKFTLYLLIFLFLISSKSYSQEPYLITSESLEIIPWVRFIVKNNLKTDKIGLSHNFNYEKKIFIKNSLGIDEFSH